MLTRRTRLAGGQGFIDQSLGDFFASTAVGYQHHMEQLHPYDAIRRPPQRADRFRPLAANHAVCVCVYIYI